MTEPTEPQTRCASCGLLFTGPPSMLGRRLACCTERCAAELAPREVARLEDWLSTIVVRCRGMGSDMATTALYSNTVAAQTFKRRRLG